MTSIRHASFVMCVVLLVQYCLGIAVNLFVTLPRQDQGAAAGSAIGKALSNGPLAVAIHAGLGLALIVIAMALTISAAAARHGGIVALAVVGLLAMGSAAYNGARFVGAGQNDASFSMALAWAVALLAYLCMLFVASPGRPIRQQASAGRRTSASS